MTKVSAITILVVVLIRRKKMQKKLEQIRFYLEEILQKEKLAAMAIGITNREKILFAEGFGMESVERPEVKVTGESLFKIASVTKIFTGLTLLSLVEEGLLSLSSPVKEILPWLCLADKETEEKVTLRHLLSHTSGLEAEYTPDGYREESALEKSLREGLPTAKILFPLGQGYQYSNWGIRLASAMGEKVTGKPFSALVEERILTPLGIQKTTFDLHVAATYPICLAHTEENGVFQVCHRIQENAARYAAGGLFSNAEDLCSLARCLLNDGKNDEGKIIVSKETIDIMKTKISDCTNYAGYGLTMMQDDFEGSKIYGHLGNANPYTTSLIFHPESGFGIVTLMNTHRMPLRLQIPKKILSILTEK